MTAIPKKCVYPDCPEMVTGGHVACGLHWAGTPDHVKREVQRRLRSWNDQGAAREYLSLYFKGEKVVSGGVL
jgi:hypothetical protein